MFLIALGSPDMIYNTIELFMNYSEGVKPKGKNLSALEAGS
jgi:hypothetical protein